jgi:hypothetical protein
MSTVVVGTCTDCITSLPTMPTVTLNGKLNVYQGQGAIMRNLQNVPISFDATNGLVVQNLNLQPQETFTLYNGAAGLILAPTAALNVVTTVTVAGTPAVTTTNDLTVTSILILDQTLTTVTITNPNLAGGAAITAFLAYVPGSP